MVRSQLIAQLVLAVLVLLASQAEGKAYSELLSNGTWPVLRVVADSHFEAGQEIGKAMRERILGYMKEAWNDTIGPIWNFANSTEGQSYLLDLAIAAANKYPQYDEEIRGLASGSELSDEYFYLLNCADELAALMLNFSDIPLDRDNFYESCSELGWVGNGYMLSGHNEDASAGVKRWAYILNVSISGEPQFVSFTYPGFLPGNAWGFNEHGILISDNALFPVLCAPDGIPRGFIGRDIYNSKSMSDAIVRATPQNVAFGYSQNIMSINEKAACNIELSAESFAVTYTVDNSSHTNSYVHLVVDQYYNNSSVMRYARIQEFPVPTSIEDYIEILGDTRDLFPIWRNGSYPDTGVITVSTTLYNLTSSDYWYAAVYDDNPKYSDPIMFLPLFQH